MSDRARSIALVDAPPNLGLRPPEEGAVPGVYKLAGALRDHPRQQVGWGPDQDTAGDDPDRRVVVRVTYTVIGRVGTRSPVRRRTGAG